MSLEHVHAPVSYEITKFTVKISFVLLKTRGEAKMRQSNALGKWISANESQRSESNGFRAGQQHDRKRINSCPVLMEFMIGQEEEYVARWSQVDQSLNQMRIGNNTSYKGQSTEMLLNSVSQTDK